LPKQDAHLWAAATMELGAVVCTAKAPRCAVCPVEQHCAWNIAGRPVHAGPPRPRQAYAGTDRQVRGRLMDVLRASDEPVTKAALDATWDDAGQRERCLTSLLDDGLVSEESGLYSL
jgi:A/G-specific adenine glycosylase